MPAERAIDMAHDWRDEPAAPAETASAEAPSDRADLSATDRAVCVTGMHRSGTSMVTRLLNLCGVDLGPEDDLLPLAPDNPEGHWENRNFNDVNEAVLAALGGCWHTPPSARAGWETTADIVPLRAQAAALARQFAQRAPCGRWGWKDPRNCLTLPLWRAVLPGLKVVICVRNPLEVVASLERRGDVALDDALGLWRRYHAELFAAVPPIDRIVTHYDAYFHDARAELYRVAGWLGLAPHDETLARAVAFAQERHRHHQVTTTELLRKVADPEVVRLYEQLCAEAGPICRMALEGQPMGDVPESLPEANERALNALARRRVVRLEADAIRLAHEREARERELAIRMEEVAGLREKVAELETRILTLVSRVEETEMALARRTERVATLTADLRAITSSRGWRVLEALWALRLRLAPVGSRREKLLLRLRRRTGAHG